MNKELQEIEQELFAINKEKRAIEQKLIAIIMVAISETIKECPVKRLGSGCFVIRCSDLIGNTWSPEFYDWKYGAKILFEKLNNVPANNWKQYLVDLLGGNFKLRDPVYFVKCIKVGSLYKIAISRKFIMKIIEKL